jgi:hypothetical protein
MEVLIQRSIALDLEKSLSRTSNEGGIRVASRIKTKTDWW